MHAISTKPPLRVIHFHFGKEGGAERFLVKLAQALDRRGVEQRFIIRPGRSWDKEIASLGPVIRNNFTRLSPMTPVLHFQAVRWVRAWKPHAVMAWRERAGRLVHRWPNVTKVMRLGDFPDHLKHMRNCDTIVGNVPAITNRCLDLGWLGHATTITNFSSAIDSCPITRKQYGTPEDAFLVVAGGRFHRRKAFDTAIKALARIPFAWLWLVGDGELRADHESLASQLGVSDRVRFIGWVAEPIHHIAAADVFLLPSRHEPLGNILLEAWQAGIPSVSTRTDGPSWYMRDGVDGLMVDIDNDAQMAEALIRLRDNPGTAREYAMNARQRLEDFMSEEAVCDAYLRLFRGETDNVGTPIPAEH